MLIMISGSCTSQSLARSSSIVGVAVAEDHVRPPQATVLASFKPCWRTFQQSSAHFTRTGRRATPSRDSRSPSSVTGRRHP